jgi:hypothetical protein
MMHSHNAGVVPLAPACSDRLQGSIIAAFLLHSPAILGLWKGFSPNRLPPRASTTAWEERSRRRSLGNAIILRRDPMTRTRGLVLPQLQNDPVALDKYLAFFGRMFSHLKPSGGRRQMLEAGLRGDVRDRDPNLYLPSRSRGPVLG